MAYNYNIKATTNPLSKNQLYEGLLVCFSNVQNNPNNTGILEKRKDTGGAPIGWTTVINGVKHNFDLYGYDISDNTIRLYGVLSDGDIDPTKNTFDTRAPSSDDESNIVSITYMTPKDYFACEALNSLIQRIDNPLAMSDGVIAALAAKSYKIAQAMAKEAYGSRQNDKKSSEESGTDYVNVNKTSLQTNTERILYNLNESIKTNINVLKDTKNILNNINESVKANTNVLKDTGIKFNGTPDVNISNTPNVNINNSPSVTVSNMPSEPIEVTGDVNVSGKVGVTGTVSVDNFPQSSTSNS